MGGVYNDKRTHGTKQQTPKCNTRQDRHVTETLKPPCGEIKFW